MEEKDQAIRHKIFDAPADRNEETAQVLEAGDRARTAELKDIVQKQGWATTRLVGIKASQAAALILKRSPDHDFQRAWTPQLSRMVQQDEMVGSERRHARPFGQLRGSDCQSYCASCRPTGAIQRVPGESRLRVI